MEPQQTHKVVGRLAPIMLLSMLMVAPGTLAVTPGYCSLRVRLTSADKIETLNLAEIQLFAGGGLRLLPVQLRAKMSTVRDLSHSASKCIDGDLLTFCQTLATDVRPVLTIDYPCPTGHTSLTKVIVTNIANQQMGDRVNSFTLDFLDAGGLEDHPSYVFEGGKPLYAIDVAAISVPGDRGTEVLY